MKLRTFTCWAAIVLGVASRATSAQVSPQNGIPSFWAGLKPGRFAVGYRVVDTNDVTRSFPLDVERIGARPMRLYVWYPAMQRTGASLPLRALVLDEPARGGAYALADPVAFARAFATLRSGTIDGVSISEREADSLLATPMYARRGAAAARGRFPLVLFAPSSPGTVPVLAEYLASRGYVVIGVDRKDDHSIQSMSFTPNAESVAAESSDLEFALGAARGMANVDAQRVGVIGYSSSGISNLAFAARSRVPRAVVVFDGWEGRDMGQPILARLPGFDPLALRGGYLDVESDNFGVQSEVVSTFIDASARVDHWRVRVAGTTHPDFASFGVATARAKRELREGFAKAQELVADFLDDRLAVQPPSVSFARAWADTIGVRVSAFPSSLTRPTMDEFYHLAEIDAAAADAVALRLSREVPAVVPFTKDGLSRLATILSLRRPKDAAIIRGIVARAFP